MENGLEKSRTGGKVNNEKTVAAFQARKDGGLNRGMTAGIEKR